MGLWYAVYANRDCLLAAFKKQTDAVSWRNRRGLGYTRTGTLETTKDDTAILDWVVRDSERNVVGWFRTKSEATQWSKFVRNKGSVVSKWSDLPTKVKVTDYEHTLTKNADDYLSDIIKPEGEGWRMVGSHLSPSCIWTWFWEREVR